MRTLLVRGACACAQAALHACADAHVNVRAHARVCMGARECTCAHERVCMLRRTPEHVHRARVAPDCARVASTNVCAGHVS
eukprot:6204306-Pleurochrysis_carterae.AAC.1